MRGSLLWPYFILLSFFFVHLYFIFLFFFLVRLYLLRFTLYLHKLFQLPESDASVRRFREALTSRNGPLVKKVRIRSKRLTCNYVWSLEIQRYTLVRK